MSKQPRVLSALLRPGESIEDAHRRVAEEYTRLGKPGAALPWECGEHREWTRMLAGTDRVVAIVDKYPLDMGGGYFYCVGDGPTEESSDDRYATASEAKDADDKRLAEMGYTFRGMD